jgi:predicted MFS family arabinose efflux permease
MRAGPGLLGLSREEWATIGIALAAATLPAVLPLMVGVLARQFGLGTEQAGYVISINMGAILAGSLSCILLAQRFGWSTLIWAGLAIMVLGNGLTMITTALPALIATRLISGWGEGVVGACCYALMGRARLPGRSIAVYTGGQAIIGAAGLGLLPSLMAAFGWHVFYVLVSLVAIPAAMLTGIATQGRERPPPVEAPASPRRLPLPGLGVLLSIFIFFVGMAMVWAFMERMGVARQLSIAQLSAALSASSLAGLAGSFVAGAAADRIQRLMGLAIGILVVVASLALLLSEGFWPYAIAIAGLSFAWAYQFPFLFRCLANTDSGGGVALMTPVATGGALTVGPAVGGFLLEHGGLAIVSGACLVLTASATAVAAALGRRRASHQLDASTHEVKA